MQHLHVRVLGRVQGVGFRHFACLRARALGIEGHARNCADGSVEIEAQGDRDSLERFLEQVKSGPRSSRVTTIEARWSEGPARFQGFEVMG
jgi:acylphosphatase